VQAWGVYKFLLLNMIFIMTLLHSATPYATTNLDESEEEELCESNCAVNIQESRLLLQVTIAPDALSSYIPELYSQGLIIEASAAFENALTSFPKKSFATQDLPENSDFIAQALTHTLERSLIHHPHFIHITQHMRLLMSTMYNMLDSAQEALERPQDLRSIFKNDSTLREFLRNVMRCVELGFVPHESTKLFTETCRALYALIQIDFTQFNTRKAIAPTTLLERLAALASRSILIDFSPFEQSDYPAVERYHEVLFSIRALRTCQTTMKHIDATITAHGFKDHTQNSSTYLSIVRYLCTDILQKVIDHYEARDVSKIYFYVLELYLQLRCLGNLPPLYTAQTANPFTGDQTVPHYVKDFFQTVPINPSAHTRVIDEFLFEKTELLSRLSIQKGHCTSQHEQLPPHCSIESIISSQHLMPSLLVYTTSDMPLVQKDTAYVFLLKDPPSLKTLQTMSEQVLLRISQHTLHTKTQCIFAFSLPAKKIVKAQSVSSKWLSAFFKALSPRAQDDDNTTKNVSYT